MINYGDVGSVLLCQCENNRTITGGLTSFSNCQGETGACATKRNEICFATRTGKGCILRHQCYYFDDYGYKFRKTFMKCCTSNYCNSRIDQNTINDFSEGNFLFSINNQVFVFHPKIPKYLLD